MQKSQREAILRAVRVFACATSFPDHIGIHLGLKASGISEIYIL